MPQYRKLHTKVLQSLDVDAMSSDFVRLTWVLLPLIVCKEGRGMMHPAWIRSNLYPLREDVTKDMVAGAMAEFIGRKMIATYSVDGREYFHIVNWHEYQSTMRDAPSPYPAPTHELVVSYSGASKADRARSISISPSLSMSEGGVGETHELLTTAVRNVARGAGATGRATLDLVDWLTEQGATPEQVTGFGEWWAAFGDGKPWPKQVRSFWDDFVSGRQPFFTKGAGKSKANGSAWAHVEELVKAGTPPLVTDPVYDAVRLIGWARLKQMTDFDAPKLRKAFEAAL